VKLYQTLGIVNITRVKGEGKDSTMWVIKQFAGTPDNN
jgi:hypothetical protein